MYRMAEAFLHLPTDERRKIIEVTSQKSLQEAHLLEKDIWVVWSIKELFASSFVKHLVFKGGTSLSKGYGVIQRFSEDVELTYDIRALIPDMVDGRENAIPPSRSQADRWTREVRGHRLPKWIDEFVMPTLEEALQRDGLSDIANLRVCGKYNEKVFIDYEPLVEGFGYVEPPVKLEFRARSTGEPCEQRLVVCDAAEYSKGLGFPTATPRIMKIERTFWEKAMAIHAYCLKESYRGKRFARHWHDLSFLGATWLCGYGTARYRPSNGCCKTSGIVF